MVAYQQKHRDCGGQGCTWCNGLGYMTGNGEAGALRGQFHSVAGVVGRATIVPEQELKPRVRQRRRDVQVPPEAA